MKPKSIKWLFFGVAVALNLILVNSWEAHLKEQAELNVVLATTDDVLDVEKLLDLTEKTHHRFKFALIPVGYVAIGTNGGALPMWGRIGQAILWGGIAFYLASFIVKPETDK